MAVVGATSPLTCRPGIAVAADGTPHIAYFDGSNVIHAKPGPDRLVAGGGRRHGRRHQHRHCHRPAERRAAGELRLLSEPLGPHPFLRRAIARRWLTAEVDTNYAGLDTALVIDSGGVPHLAYGSLSGITYARFEPSVASWTIDWIGGDLGFVGNTSLALEANGMPHVSWFDSAVVEIRHATGGIGAWLVETVAPMTATAATDTSIALDPAGDPYIAYADMDTEQVTVAYRSAGVWVSPPWVR